MMPTPSTNKIVFSVKDQDRLLTAALEPTFSLGWFADAIAVAAAFQNSAQEWEIGAIGIFQNLTMSGCDGHVASLTPSCSARPDVLRGLLRYGFVRLDSPHITMRIASPLRSTQRLALRAGFDFEARLRATTRGNPDTILMTMTRDAWAAQNTEE